MITCETQDDHPKTHDHPKLWMPDSDLSEGLLHLSSAPARMLLNVSAPGASRCPDLSNVSAPGSFRCADLSNVSAPGASLC